MAMKQAKYVATIKEQAEITMHKYKGKRGKLLASPLTIQQMRIYIEKILFLCEEIEKRDKENVRIRKLLAAGQGKAN